MAKTKAKLDLAKQTCDYEIKSLTKLECQHGHRITQAARPMAELIQAVRKAGYKVQGQ